MRAKRSPTVMQVRLTDGWLAEWQQLNRSVTLTYQFETMRAQGTLAAMARQGEVKLPHPFWESDLAKWLEAACYSLATHPDVGLQALVDEAIELIVGLQQDDGYLNLWYTLNEPGQRWTNLRDRHELYTAGHLMEAAVAHHAATGSTRLLDCLCRYADHIAARFGPAEEGKAPGYPGHPEIELALVLLAEATGREEYLHLARFFVEERGRQPHYFDAEAVARGDDPARYWAGGYDYLQAHLPVREQTTAEGHSVRAMYLYAAMADLARETGDESLLEACQKLWANVTGQRMYVTGGIGSAGRGERFTVDYDLPADTAYTETCAAIGLIFWARRLLQIERRGDYADTLELALYNAVLSGLARSGREYFYSNPLAVTPARHRGDFPAARQPWFHCACCPPNLARLLASLGAYAYTFDDEGIDVHLYAASEAELPVAGGLARLAQRTDYPWSGQVRLEVRATPTAEWTLALRLPGWCREPRATVNGALAEGPVRDGYQLLRRAWQAGDVVELTLPMPVERLHARLEVDDAAGRVALRRGPLVYCAEEIDNGPLLDGLLLSPTAEATVTFEPETLGGCAVIRLPAWRERPGAEDLYTPAPPAYEKAALVAVPYALWANRGVGERRVWLRCAPWR